MVRGFFCFTRLRATYARESDIAVTAFGGGGELLQVVVDKLATRGLHHTSAVGGGVVRRALAEGDTLGHW